MEKASTRLSVYDMTGKVVDNLQLDEKIFNGKINKALLYEAKKMYEANKRQGTHCAKTRSEVSGGGAKPWRQKGTGRARVGSSRNPIWRHGGVAMGPRPRDYSYSLPKKALSRALVSGLNARLSEQMIKPVVKLEMEEPKTGTFKGFLENIKVQGRVLVVVDSVSPNIILSSRNLEGVSLKAGRNINVMDILQNDYIVIEKEALEKMSERLK